MRDPPPEHSSSKYSVIPTRVDFDDIVEEFLFVERFNLSDIFLNDAASRVVGLDRNVADSVGDVTDFRSSDFGVTRTPLFLLRPTIDVFPEYCEL